MAPLDTLFTRYKMVEYLSESSDEELSEYNTNMGTPNSEISEFSIETPVTRFVGTENVLARNRVRRRLFEPDSDSDLSEDECFELIN